MRTWLLTAAGAAIGPFISLVEAQGTSSTCGFVGEFTLGAPQADFWDNIGTQYWLDNWWTNNSGSFSSNGGFGGTLGAEFLGQSSTLICKSTDGQDCSLELCNPALPLNKAGVVLQPAYYTMLSALNLVDQFQMLYTSVIDASAISSLQVAGWTSAFYYTTPSFNGEWWYEILYAVGIAISMVFTFSGTYGGAAIAALQSAGTASQVASAAAKAAPVIKAGASAATKEEDDPEFPLNSIASTFAGTGLWAASNIVVDKIFGKAPPTAGNVGQAIAQYANSTFMAMLELQETLLSGGQDPSGNDIRFYLDHGAYLAASFTDASSTIQFYLNMMLAISINFLWTSQPVFIMGGGNCDDSNGIGNGPQEGKVCRNGQAWYIYQWFDNVVNGITGSKTGYVWSPQGNTSLGAGNVYSGVSLEDVINSSLDAYIVAKLNYTNDIKQARLTSALDEGWADPIGAGVAWEGIFTIPVCNITWAVNQNLPSQQYILQPWNGQSRPQWCGPVCEGDMLLTQQFLTVSNLYGDMAKYFNPLSTCDKSTPWYIPTLTTNPGAPTATPTGLLYGQAT